MIIKTIAAMLMFAAFAVAADEAIDYRVLATTKTSTMEKELNEAAEAGFRMGKVMGGNTAGGGAEVLVVMSKLRSAPAARHYSYKLLATSKTSTMEKELNSAGSEGFKYIDQTIFNSTFGGDEVVSILELDRESIEKLQYEYKLLATTKTSTMQKELQSAGDLGFMFVGVTVSKTAFGGKEVLSILRKDISK